MVFLPLYSELRGVWLPAHYLPSVVIEGIGLADATQIISNNTCVVRACHAFNKCPGHQIPPNTGFDTLIAKGTKYAGWRYLFRTTDFARYLKQRYGPPTFTIGFVPGSPTVKMYGSVRQERYPNTPVIQTLLSRDYQRGLIVGSPRGLQSGHADIWDRQWGCANSADGQSWQNDAEFWQLK